jgi:hypothetical protein
MARVRILRLYTKGRRSAERRTTSCRASMKRRSRAPFLLLPRLRGRVGRGHARLSALLRGFVRSRPALPGITGSKREDPLRHQCSEHLAVRSRAGRADTHTACRLRATTSARRNRTRSVSRRLRLTSLTMSEMERHVTEVATNVKGCLWRRDIFFASCDGWDRSVLRSQPFSRWRHAGCCSDFELQDVCREQCRAENHLGMSLCRVARRAGRTGCRLGALVRLSQFRPVSGQPDQGDEPAGVRAVRPFRPSRVQHRTGADAGVQEVRGLAPALRLTFVSCRSRQLARRAKHPHSFGRKRPRQVARVGEQNDRGLNRFPPSQRACRVSVLRAPQHPPRRAGAAAAGRRRRRAQ